MIWAHQWGKTACDSLSYRFEHNEEDTAISTTTTPPTPPPIPGRKEGGGGGGGVWERRLININTPIIYIKEDFGEFLRLFLQKKIRRRSKYVCGAESKQVQMIQSATSSEWRSAARCVSPEKKKAWHSVSVGVTTNHYSCNTITLLFIFSKLLLTPSHVAVET